MTMSKEELLDKIYREMAEEVDPSMPKQSIEIIKQLHRELGIVFRRKILEGSGELRREN
jgi:hypothetical protein